MHRGGYQSESRNPVSDAGMVLGSRPDSKGKAVGSRAQRSMASVCSWCNRARDKRGHWSRVHSLLFDHPELTQTHGVCPECIKTHFPTRVSVA